jgi:uncharacterized membrane protein YfcA
MARPARERPDVTFPISGAHLNPAALVLTGFIVGVCGGFFGVGGSFLAGPALFGLGLPMNYVIGTDLAHLVGKSLVAVRQHRLLGHVDYRLATIMMIGTVPGVEWGARAIEALKRTGQIAGVVGTVFAVALVAISAFMGWEVWSTIRTRRQRGQPLTTKGPDRPVFSRLSKWVQRFPLPPRVRLKSIGVRVSFWPIFAVSIVSGFFSGFLGAGAGYIRMPSMVYLLGIPTHIAVGTDLFEIVVSAGYGTVTHALKGNVDILVALVMHTGAAMGAQIGAVLTKHIGGVWIRLAFIPLPLIGAYLLFVKLRS